jgi:hypothetical protein
MTITDTNQQETTNADKHNDRASTRRTAHCEFDQFSAETERKFKARMLTVS